MKRFFSLFSSSAKELNNVRCLAVTGMLLALAIVIRSFSIEITPELRISFGFIPIVAIAMLYGPVVCGMSNFLLDILGFLIDNKSGRGYYPPLALVTIIAGIIYGIFLYRKQLNFILIALSRAGVVLICNIILNSYILYTGLIGRTLDFTDSTSLHSFYIWFAPRVIKNAIQLPFDIGLLCILLPAIYLAYKKTVKISRT